MSNQQQAVPAETALVGTVVSRAPSGSALAPLGSVESFGEAVKMARFLAPSALIPETFKDKPENIVIAIDIAHRSGAGLFAVMQSLYIVHGKPSFSATYMIATLNATGRFSPLNYVYEGEGSSRGCYAEATELKTGKVYRSIRVSMDMARAEGWIERKGSKWKTMPDLMLQYRAATFFVRAYAPEVSLGLPTTDEVEDIGPQHVVVEQAAAKTTPEDFGVRTKSSGGRKAKDKAADSGEPDPPADDRKVVDGDVVDTSTGEVLGKASADDSRISEVNAQKLEQMRQQQVEAGAAAKAERERLDEEWQRREAEKEQLARAEQRHEQRAAEPDRGADDGDYLGEDLTAGMRGMLERKIAACPGVTMREVAEACGGTVSKATINAALTWLDKRSAR